MKKTQTFLLPTALLLGTIVPVAAAEQPISTEVSTVQENFMSLTGTVNHLHTTDGRTYASIEQGDDTFTLTLLNHTNIFDNTGVAIELKKGMQFTAYVSVHKPMFMIYPPQYTPELVIVQTKNMGTVTVDTFNENLATDDLKLNLGENIVIEDLAGNRLTVQDIINKDIAVFYTTTTRSIPAQTSPTKILVLSDPKTDVQMIMNFDQYEKNGVAMVPLRLIAEKLGWQVDSTGKGALLSKGHASYTITRDQKEYGFNGSIQQFEQAPLLLEANKTYVPFSFIENLY